MWKIIYEKITGRYISTINSRLVDTSSLSEEVSTLDIEDIDSVSYLNNNYILYNGVWVYKTNIDLEKEKEKQWNAVKATRNEKLVASDWTQLPDVPVASKEVWQVYRQALRDVTDQIDPFNIVWPEPPTN